MQQNPSISVIGVVVHYGDPDQTLRLVDKLQQYEAIKKLVVVLHDNYPIAQNHSKTAYLRSRNLGYAAGLNLALKFLCESFSETELVLAMNPDISIEEAQIIQMVREHLASQADCTFPTIRENRNLIHGYEFSNLGTMKRVTKNARFFPATCFLLSLAVWQKTGGFNEEYFHYYEDADFCLRLEKTGSRIHHVESVIVEHFGLSRIDYPGTSLPRYAVRNHLLFLSQLGKLNALSFINVTIRHFLYLFRWKRGWRGIGEWYRGVQEFCRS